MDLRVLFSETTTISWQNELKNNWCRIQEQTTLSLALIKRDRIRKNLSFDDKFKVDFLRAANTMYAKFQEYFRMYFVKRC